AWSRLSLQPSADPQWTVHRSRSVSTPCCDPMLLPTKRTERWSKSSSTCSFTPMRSTPKGRRKPGMAKSSTTAQAWTYPTSAARRHGALGGKTGSGECCGGTGKGLPHQLHASRAADAANTAATSTEARASWPSAQCAHSGAAPSTRQNSGTSQCRVSRARDGRDMSDITRVGVVGCGLMGSGIAEVCARAGLDVLVREIDDDALAAGRARLEKSLKRALDSGKITQEAFDATRGNLGYTTKLEDLADRDLVIEAATENPDLKIARFAGLDRIVARRDALLASTASSPPIVRIAQATTRPGQVLGLHFFNPAPVQKLVEIVRSILTDQRTLARAQVFAA